MPVTEEKSTHSTSEGLASSTDAAFTDGGRDHLEPQSRRLVALIHEFGQHRRGAYRCPVVRQRDEGGTVAQAHLDRTADHLGEPDVTRRVRTSDLPEPVE